MRGRTGILCIRSRRQSWSSASSHSLPQLISSSLSQVNGRCCDLQNWDQSDFPLFQPLMLPPFTFLKITTRQFLVDVLCVFISPGFAPVMQQHWPAQCKTERVRPPPVQESQTALCPKDLAQPCPPLQQILSCLIQLFISWGLLQENIGDSKLWHCCKIRSEDLTWSFHPTESKSQAPS